MDAPGKWNVQTVRQQAGPPGAGEPFRQTWIHHGPHSSTNVTQVGDASGLRPHIHREHDEIIQIVEGEGEFRIGDRVERVGPGDVIVAPAGAVHSPMPRSGGFVLLSVFAPPFDPANPDRVFVEE